MTPPARPWWTGIDPAELALNCSGHEHRLRWAEGRLLAPDHPDADRERALVALGGDPVPCLDLLDIWLDHADDLDLLVLTSRGPSDRLPDLGPGDGVRYSGGYTSRSGFTATSISRASLRSGGRPRMSGGWTAYRPLNARPDPTERGVELDSALFATLGRGLTDRWVATVVAAWTARIREADNRVSAATPKLRAALYGRLLETIRNLDSRHAPIDLMMVDADSARSITAMDGRIRCELPFSWLGDVWARGFATIFGHLCLDVEAADDGDWQLRVVSPGLQRARTMSIRLLSSP